MRLVTPQSWMVELQETVGQLIRLADQAQAERPGGDSDGDVVAAIDNFLGQIRSAPRGAINPASRHEMIAKLRVARRSLAG
jgi:hypothetical protein